MNSFFREEKMETREDKRMVELDFFLFQNCPFWTYIMKEKKNPHIHFLVHSHSSWYKFGLHLVRDPKALWIDLL